MPPGDGYALAFFPRLHKTQDSAQEDRECKAMGTLDGAVICCLCSLNRTNDTWATHRGTAPEARVASADVTSPHSCTLSLFLITKRDPYGTRLYGGGHRYMHANIVTSCVGCLVYFIMLHGTPLQSIPASDDKLSNEGLRTDILTSPNRSIYSFTSKLSETHRYT